MPQQTVLVTGFGPFGQHNVNASWECAKKLQEIGLGDGIQLVIDEIPVEYETVRKKVPELWVTHKPELVVHLGVSGIAHEITLEQRANNTGYGRKDVKGEVACGEVCVPGAEDCIIAGLDMNRVCEEVNNSGTKAKAIVSNDAGRYLCDFSYFTSLYINPKRTAFIHVPMLEKHYNVEELAEGLQAAILAMLRQIQETGV